MTTANTTTATNPMASPTLGRLATALEARTVAALARLDDLEAAIADTIAQAEQRAGDHQIALPGQKQVRPP